MTSASVPCVTAPGTPEESTMADESGPRADAYRLLGLVNGARTTDVAVAIDELVEPIAADSEQLRGVVTELVCLAARTVVRLAGDRIPTTKTYAIELQDPRRGLVTVDDLDPPMRALVRALLAELAGHPRDRADQITLALACGDPHVLADLLYLALLWTLDLIGRAEIARR